MGNKRTFAGALEWPGWCRSGRDEQQAIQALFDYAPRYAMVAGRLGFKAPASVGKLEVVERLNGEKSADFGTLGVAPSYDDRPLDAQQLKSLEKILEACWARFDKTLARAHGKALRKGARGGGRELDAIVQHVLDGEGGYIYRLAWKRDKAAEHDTQLTRQAIRDALGASVRGEVPKEGPRGGKKWTARYFVRREAWHVLDHAWEIEDRLE